MEYLKNNKGKIIYIICSIAFVIAVFFGILNEGKKIEYMINNEMIDCTGGCI